MTTRSLSALATVVLAVPASAQSFNIDFGEVGSPAPASSYGAAGLPGYWNVLQVPHTTPSQSPQVFDEMLLDLWGNPTNVGVHQFGGMTLVTENDPGPTGQHTALMNDAVLTFSAQLETCLYINGLENGTYEVLVYAWRPNHPEMDQKVRFDFIPGFQTCGGGWPGGQLEGVSYSRQIVQVTSGYMGPHVGVAPGENPATGAACCGMQLRRLGPPVGATYCTSNPNSTGAVAAILARGSELVSENDLTLEVTSLPVDRFGYFVMADSQGFIPLFGGSQGNLCLGQPLVRFSGNVLSSGLEGNVLFAPDLTNLPQNTVFQPGEEWNFQMWYRDVNPSNTSNTSNAVAIGFR